MASRTYYPEMTKHLYALTALIGERRTQIVNRSNFNSTDTANLDALQSALVAATQAFPQYTEPA